MASVKFLVDNLCASFTADSLLSLVRKQLTERPCTIDDIAVRITESDRSLDIKSAKSLAEAAVEEMAEAGDVAVRGEYVHAAGTLPR